MSFWDKLNELKDEHGDFSQYLNRFGLSNEDEASADTSESTNATEPSAPPLIHISTPEENGGSRRPSLTDSPLLFSLVKTVQEANKKTEEEQQQQADAGTEVPVVQTTQPTTVTSTPPDESKAPIPDVQTVQPTHTGNGVIPNGHHAVEMPPTNSKGGAKCALCLAICTLVLFPPSFLCTLPSCICAIMAIKNTKEPTTGLTTSSYVCTVLFYVIMAIVLSFVLGGLIFGGLTVLSYITLLLELFNQFADDPQYDYMTTVMWDENANYVTGQ